jgi:HlyD family secretion protein
MAKWMSPTRLGFVAAAVALALLIPVLVGRSPKPTVQATVARQERLVVEVTTNGVVEPIDEAEVRARLDGRVVDVREAGTEVGAGDVLLVIDASAVAAELEAVRSERLKSLESLRSARATLKRTRQRFATDKKLFEAGALNAEAYANSKAILGEAEAQAGFLEQEVPVRVASLDLRAEELQAQKEAATVTAEASGTVYRSDVKKGETVRFGDPVLWVADLDQLRVRANIDQVDLGKVRQQQLVRILSNAYGDRAWSGRISEVIPRIQLKENRAVAEALAAVELPVNGLLPGMNVDVEIVVQQAEGVLQVPAESIFKDQFGAFVYAIESGRVQRRAVETGRSSVTRVEIVTGVEAGDEVVVGPVAGLQDGMRVDVWRADELDL